MEYVAMVVISLITTTGIVVMVLGTRPSKRNKIK